MIRGVRVINPNGEDILMRLDGSEQGPFSLWSIEGLDQGEAEINVDEIASVDGAIFNSARQLSRELTITAILNDSTGITAIQYAREQAYRYFPLKKLITVIFYLDDLNGGLKSYITEGYVKSNPVDIFAKRCATRVTIVRTKPFFYENYTHGEFFDIYDNMSANISVNDMNILTDFAEHTYRFNYATNTYYWNMFIDGSQAYVLVDIRKYGINVLSTPSSGATFKVRKKNYINYKVNTEGFVDAGEGRGRYSISPSASTNIVNNGVDVGCVITLALNTNFPGEDLGIEPLFIHNITPGDPLSSKTTVQISFKQLEGYPDFATRGLEIGDKIIINTNTFQKDVRIYLHDTGEEISCLGIVDFQNVIKNQEWPYIMSGDNQIIAYQLSLGGETFPLSTYFGECSIKWSKAVRGI